MNLSFKIILLLTTICLAVTGCATKPAPKGRSIEEVYSSTHRAGSRDAINLLREGMRNKGVYGTSTPYTPMRNAEEIIPIWIPSYIDKRTGRMVQGHWQHTVIRKGQWALN